MPQRFRYLQEQSNKKIDNVFIQTEALLAIYLELGFQKGLPATRGWAASPDFLRELVDFALTRKPEVIVECSCGVTTLILARSVQINGTGHIYSLEHLSEYAQKTRENLSKHGLTEYATVLDSPLQTVSVNGKNWLWYSLDNLPNIEIDMLAIDGPPKATGKLARYPCGPLLFNRLSNAGAVFLDDASRADEREIITLWIQENPEFNYVFRDCEKGCVILYKDKKNTS